MESSQEFSGSESRVEFTVSGKMPLSGRFARQRPAADEGPEQAWTLAQNAIDHGAYVLDTVNAVAAGRQVRDVVLAALLRRALLTAEGVRNCLYHSLEEPAIVLLRTLLEVELNMRLVVLDDTDRMARRLAAFHYLKARRHVTKVLEHPEVQAGDVDFQEFMKDAGRRQKEYYNSGTFDEVRRDLAESQHWHGHKSIAAAFEAVGGGTDYLHLYDSFSPFVHAANLDFDFVDIIDGRPQLRAIVQRDPARIQHYLQGAVLILLRIIDMYLVDKGEKESYAEPFVVEFADGDVESIAPVDALQQYAIAIWGASEGWSIEAGPGNGSIVDE